MSMLLSRTSSLGCCLLGSSWIHVFALSLFLSAAAIVVSAAEARGIACEVTPAAAEQPSPKIIVTVDPPAAPIRTGDRIAINWKAPGLNLDCRTPLYLVLTTPMRSRYEGDKFLAVPGNAEAPYGIKYRRDQTRVFIPLHIGPGQAQGTLVVKIYETGPLRLDWTLIEVPKLGSDPRQKTDFAIGEEHATTAVPLGKGISVFSGNPSIVVRDRFSADAPKQTFRSNSGEFDLQVFDGYYRVLDAKTGELIQERAGWDPNFSPTSRFLGAYAAGPGFEIIDLYADQVVTTNDRLVREHGFVSSINLAAWSEGDTWFALGFQNWGGIELQQSLVDGSQRSFPETSCHFCPGIASKMHLDSDAGVVSYEGDEPGWESLFDRSLGTAAAASEALKRVPLEAWEETDDMMSERRSKISQLRADAEKQISLSTIDALAKRSFFNPRDFFKPDGASSGGTDSAVESHWRFPGQIRLSHICLRDDQDSCVGRLVDWQEKLRDLEKQDDRLVRLRVAHVRTSPRSTAQQEPNADARFMKLRGESLRGTPDGRDILTPGVIWDRLATLVQPAKGATKWKKLSEGSPVSIQSNEETDARRTKIGARLSGPSIPGAVSAIVRAIPQAARFFREWEWSKDYTDLEQDEFWGVNKEAVVVGSDMVRQYAQWRLGDRNYSLARSFFDNGESSRNWLFLIEGSKTGTPQLHDLTHRLRYRVGTRPSGLDDHGKIETTREFATTMGFGGWPDSIDRVSIAFDRYLLASGSWTRDSRRWLLMYDLPAGKIVFFNRDVPDASTETRFAVTDDGTAIVQTSANGHLHIYNVADEKLILSGLNVDDELVVYDSRGYYVSSPEGAQFVFLKFPGSSGYNSLRQFSAILNRPEVIRNVLAGTTAAPDPSLGAPPKVNLQVETSNSASARLAKVTASATSPTGLSRLRIFVDGRLVKEDQISGSSSLSETTIDLLPESRWIAVVAVDTTGYESVPQGAELVGATAATTSRLFGIAVGTNNYVTLPRLSSAAADARKFGQALTDLKGKLYSAVEVERLIDAADLRNNLPAKIRHFVAKAGEHDTIMLFVAGHGFQDETTGRFFVATRESNPDSAEETMISWDQIASSISDARARVIVFIDACHSGAAGTANDAAISTFLGRKAPVTLIAASKGRQISEENATGGFFTTALVKAIGAGRNATDINGNGAIELTELYSAIKREVVKETRRKQTPWVARDNMVGETPLF
jgi:Caspase domain